LEDNKRSPGAGGAEASKELVQAAELNSSPDSTAKKICKRHSRIAAVRLDNGNDLVVSATKRDQIDIRVWSRTGYASMPTGQGFSIPKWAVNELVDALKAAKRMDAAS
jgi:hypothetical protein